MALKTVHVSNVPGRASSGVVLSSATFSDNGSDGVRTPFKQQRFLVIGHRGSGMNMHLKLKEIEENSMLSFNEAGKSGVDFVEFDVQVILEYAKNRPIIFSSFQPDAARVIRKLQNLYPVKLLLCHCICFFLTDGGCEVYSDVRMNSLDEAIKLCLMSGLQGIVSEVRAIFRKPGAISRIKEANLTLLTYGQLNNVPEAVYMQHLMGIDGVIVDLVREITEAVFEFSMPAEEEEGLHVEATTRPRFSQRELSFLLKLIPELIHV
ncbi:hypothetical protein MRB53_002038 [Persea americana]|uniref:Uncharacterized protein n=1 Tax=Persea americana TaxID=3435 RepID=A0ACC2MTF5_PERAE|nr:hypothetical protein MRB53_002038 [Persea americana]